MTPAVRRIRIDRTPPDSPRAARLVPVSEPRKRPPLRILVVDDDVDARLLIGALVESHFDAQAVLVASADEAVESVSRVLPDLVITDGLMPGGGAIELLGRLRGIPRAARVPVIVATGSIDQGKYRHLRDAGALAVIPKSAGPDEFARAVGAVLGVASA